MRNNDLVVCTDTSTCSTDDPRENKILSAKCTILPHSHTLSAAGNQFTAICVSAIALYGI